MNERVATQATPPTVTPARNSLLQRKCACGGPPGIVGECTECREKRLGLQRRPTGQSEPPEVPPTVNEELGSLGQPFEPDTPTLKKSRFGHNFGLVRVRAPLEKVQAKLNIGQPGDRYEQEANRIAEQIVRASEQEEAVVKTESVAPLVTPLLRSQVEPEEDSEVQAKRADSYASIGNPDLESRLQSLRGEGRSLPPTLREFFGVRFGYNFDQVRILTDARAAETAYRIGARAFTFGHSIGFAPGQYAPESSEGRGLLAHELTHVVQQDPTLPAYPPPATSSHQPSDVHGRSWGRMHPPLQVAGPRPMFRVRSQAPIIVQRDETENEPMLGYLMFLDDQGNKTFELPVQQDPALGTPPPGIYNATLLKRTGDVVSFAARVPGKDQRIMITAEISPSEAKKIIGAKRIVFAVTFGAEVTDQIPEEEPVPEGEQIPEGQVPEETETPEGEEDKDAPPPTGEPKPRKPEGSAEHGTPEGTPEGTGETAGPGSKYGWLGLLPKEWLEQIPPEAIRALEKAFELLGNAEEYVALRELVTNLGKLDGHMDELRELFSDVEKLLGVVLAVEDPELTPAIQELGKWVRSRPEERAAKRPSAGKPRAKGLVAITGKVTRLLDKLRAILGPVFVTRSGFEEILSLASLALAAPGAEFVFEMARDPQSAPDAVRARTEALTKDIAQSIRERMDRVRQFLLLPETGITEDDLISREELAIAITRAAGNFVPKHYRPFVWVLEKVGLVDLVAENMLAEAVPKGALESINKQLREVLTQEVLGPLVEKVRPELDSVIDHADGLLNEALGQILDETLVQREEEGPVPEVDELRLNDLMRRSRGAPLPTGIRAQMEGAIGFDFSNVRVHTDADAAEASTLLHARAFTRQNDIYIDPAVYAPHTSDGRRLLAHELTHVVQQSNGAPTGQIQRAAIDLARRYVEKATEKVKAGAQAAFTPDHATSKTAEQSLKALDRILGQKVVSEDNPTLPKGYHYVHEFALPKKGKKGKQVSRPIKDIRRNPQFMLYLPPLEIDKQTRRIKLDLSSGYDPNARARAQLRRAMNCAEKEQAHHVIPLQLQSHPLVEIAMRDGGWKLNGRDNGSCLPVTYHYGSHRSYTEMVGQRLDGLDLKFKGNRDWSVIGQAFLRLVKELKAGLAAQKYKMR